jgi:hypothetical protein
MKSVVINQRDFYLTSAEKVVLKVFIRCSTLVVLTTATKNVEHLSISQQNLSTTD